jgi:hypothetical protein
MPETNGSIFKRVKYERHHSPSASKTFAWSLANGSGRPPRELTDVPYTIVLTPGTTTSPDRPYTAMCSPFPSEDYSPVTDSEAVIATQGPGLFVFIGRRSESFESFTPNTQTNRLRDVGYITLQINGKYIVQDKIVGPTTYENTLQDAIVGPITCEDATVGVYTIERDSVLGELGTYRLETCRGVNVQVGRPQGSWVITVCTPDGDGDGEGTIGKCGESIDFCATVTRGEKGHYTDGGTLVYKYGPGWYGLEAVRKKEQDTSHDKNEGPDRNEKDREEGQAEKPSVTKVSEEGEKSFSEKDRDWCEGDERSEDRSTNTPSQSGWRRWFGGRRRTDPLPHFTKRQ